MFDKINIKNILQDHFSTLQNERTGNGDVLDYIVFFVLPLLISGVLVWIFNDLQQFASILITSLSIFTGLLFNLVLLTYDLIKRNEKQDLDIKDKSDLKTKEDHDIVIKGKILRQIFTNISYSIVVAIFTIISLLLLYIWNNPVYKYIIGFVIYFLVLNFFLTLLMVLKRTHRLLSSEF